jgi:hypothetical protein
MYGICFTFEPKKPVLAAGPSNGLKMRVYLNFHENLTEFNAIMGGLGGLIRIEKSSDKKIDHDVDGLYIETGKWHNIQMRRRYKTSLPRPYSNCEIDDDRSKFSQNEIYQKIQKSPYQYSQSFCLRPVTCTQKKLNFKFECEFGIPHSNPHSKTPKIPIPHSNSHLKTPKIPIPHSNSHLKTPKIPIPHSNSHLKTPKIPIPHSIPHSESSILLQNKAFFSLFRIEFNYID